MSNLKLHLFEMLRLGAEAQKAKALLTLELYLITPLVLVTTQPGIFTKTLKKLSKC